MIKNWMVKVFGNTYTATENPELETVPDEVVKPDISEPVLSFVECVRNNPKRFKVIKDKNSAYNALKVSSYTNHYRLKDKKLNKLFKTSRVITNYNHCYIDTNPDWLTEDEIEFVFESLKEIYEQYYKERKEKVSKYKREKYIKLYCEK